MKRTGVQKNMNTKEDGEPPISVSTSLTSMEVSEGQNPSSDNTIEGENASKQMKRDESLNSSLGEVEAGACQSQESIGNEISMDNMLCDESFINLMEVEVGPSQEESSIKEASMDNLAPEMLMEILKCVPTRYLFNCRLVNRQWSAIASGILRNRSNARIDFDYTDGKFVCEKNRSLANFLTCIKNATNCPYSQFYFVIGDDTDPLQFSKNKFFKQFTSYFASSNQRLKSLSLHFDFLDDSVEMFQILTSNLRDLLLKKLPRLEELVLDFEISAQAPQVKLFPIPTEQTKSTLEVQLPHLKFVHFDSPMILYYTEFFKDLLNAAVKLNHFSMRVFQITDFQFLDSLGKLDLLKKAVIRIQRDFFYPEGADKNCAPLSLPLIFPKLDNLKLITDTDDTEIPLSLAANFLGHLFESSKDTLTNICMEPNGFFPGLQLPTFKNLRRLCLNQCKTFPQRIFPPGIRSKDVFSSVSHLDFYVSVWESAFPREDSIPLLPNVKSLILNESQCKGNAISILAMMCVNLEKLQIHKGNYDDESPELHLFNVGRAIWTHMKQLESLEFDVDVDLPENNSTALDSCFTGISMENCKRLFEVVQAKETLEKYGFQTNVPQSKIELIAKREHPSILDMKDLKTLTINPYSGKTLLKRTDLFTKCTWISEKYAFKFLPHLKPTEED